MVRPVAMILLSEYWTLDNKARTLKEEKEDCYKREGACLQHAGASAGVL